MSVTTVAALLNATIEDTLIPNATKIQGEHTSFANGGKLLNSPLVILYSIFMLVF